MSAAAAQSLSHDDDESEDAGDDDRSGGGGTGFESRRTSVDGICARGLRMGSSLRGLVRKGICGEGAAEARVTVTVRVSVWRAEGNGTQVGRCAGVRAGREGGERERGFRGVGEEKDPRQLLVQIL